MVNAKKMAEALLSRARGQEQAPEDKGPDGLELAAQAMLSAFEKKDPKALAQAMRDFSDQYEPQELPDAPLAEEG